MPDVAIPREWCDGRRLPSVCVLTGRTEGVGWQRVPLTLDHVSLGGVFLDKVAGFNASDLLGDESRDDLQRIEVDLPVTEEAWVWRAFRTRWRNVVLFTAVGLVGIYALGLYVHWWGRGTVWIAMVSFMLILLTGILLSPRVAIAYVGIRERGSRVVLRIPSREAAAAFESAVLAAFPPGPVPVLSMADRAAAVKKRVRSIPRNLPKFLARLSAVLAIAGIAVWKTPFLPLPLGGLAAGLLAMGLLRRERGKDAFAVAAMGAALSAVVLLVNGLRLAGAFGS